MNLKNSSLLLLLLLLSFTACKDRDEGKKVPIVSIPNVECANDSTIQIQEGPLASGCPNTEYPAWCHSDYVLPYPVGVSHKTGLCPCGGSYHSDGQPDKFAIDFDMPIGSIVTASRGGTVIQVEESGFDYSQPNNLVIIDHGDGTFAQYMHLTKNGASVDIGDFVEKGAEIGLSGATGLAGYPHLHFVVTSGGWQWEYTSSPVTFSNTLSNDNSLATRTVYEAFAY